MCKFTFLAKLCGVLSQMMTPTRRWLLALLVLCVLLMLAGGVQAGSGLYLLLKANSDVASGALILAGLWVSAT